MGNSDLAAYYVGRKVKKIGSRCLQNENLLYFKAKKNEEKSDRKNLVTPIDFLSSRLFYIKQ